MHCHILITYNQYMQINFKKPHKDSTAAGSTDKQVMKHIPKMW
jgi:hypothetical protein